VDYSRPEISLDTTSPHQARREDVESRRTVECGAGYLILVLPAVLAWNHMEQVDGTIAINVARALKKSPVFAFVFGGYLCIKGLCDGIQSNPSPATIKSRACSDAGPSYL
jgi:hypothetical protein